MPPGLPLLKKLGWETINKLISSETNVMFLKSLYELAPKYITDLFTKTFQLASRNLRNTATDLRLRKKKSKNAQVG